MKKMIAILSIAILPLFAEETRGQEQPETKETTNFVAVDSPDDVEKPKDPESKEVSQLIALDSTEAPTQEPKPQEPEEKTS